MKKFALILLVAVLCVPIFAFAACADPSDDPYDLSTKEIGYEIAVYPDCEFSYVVKWTEYNYNPETGIPEHSEKSCTVNITEFNAVLLEKHLISEGDVLEEEYERFTVKIHVEGATDPAMAGDELRFVTGNITNISTVAEDGSIVWDFEYSFLTESYYYLFNAIRHDA